MIYVWTCEQIIELENWLIKDNIRYLESLLSNDIRIFFKSKYLVDLIVEKLNLHIFFKH